MNKRQRDANRATARVARWILHGTWSDAARDYYCRTQGLPLNTPEETCRRLQRYGFLVAYAARNDAEQAEMKTLRAALLAGGIDPGWEEVPRRKTTDEDLAVFQIRKERP